MQPRKAPSKSPLAALLTTCALIAIPRAVHGDRIWWDGSRDEEHAPPGKLLSDNEGYWGDTILTGVDYAYETEPTNPADIWRDDPERFGRRLLDGRPSGNWWVPVGVNAKALVLQLDQWGRLCYHAVRLVAT